MHAVKGAPARPPIAIPWHFHGSDTRTQLTPPQRGAPAAADSQWHCTTNYDNRHITHHAAIGLCASHPPQQSLFIVHGAPTPCQTSTPTPNDTCPPARQSACQGDPTLGCSTTLALSLVSSLALHLLVDAVNIVLRLDSDAAIPRDEFVLARDAL